MTTKPPMRRAQFAVTTTLPSKSGFVWWPAEFEVPADIDDAAALALLMEDLIEDKLIMLTKLEIDGPGHDRRVVRRSPFVLGINVIATITPLHIRLVDEG